MRIFFLGQKPIGEMAFDHLCEWVDVVGACSNTDYDNWWGTAGIRHEVFVPSYSSRSGPFLAIAVKRSGADTIVSVQHPWIIPDDVLHLVNNRAFNLHLAPLPAYKGYYSINHAILNGDDFYGVTMHWITNDVDGGPIAYESRFPIHPRDTALSLYHKAEASAMGLLHSFIADVKTGAGIPRIDQVGNGKFYGKSTIDNRKQIFHPDETLIKARAFYFPPFEPAYVVVEGRKYHVTPGEQNDYI